MYSNNKVSDELWAVLDTHNAILWSRGGSSTNPKLMVYPSEESAKKALKSPWIKQMLLDKAVQIKCIYKKPEIIIPNVKKGRIKVGATIFQDHGVFTWPNCKPPHSEYRDEEYQFICKNPYMIFDVEWDGKHWTCKADGYGRLLLNGEQGGYGNGAILISDLKSVELVY